MYQRRFQTSFASQKQEAYYTSWSWSMRLVGSLINYDKRAQSKSAIAITHTHSFFFTQTQLDIQRMVNTHLNELVENKPCKKTEERNVPSSHGMAPRVFCARNVRMTSQLIFFTYFYTWSFRGLLISIKGLDRWSHSNIHMNALNIVDSSDCSRFKGHSEAMLCRRT